MVSLVTTCDPLRFDLLPAFVNHYLSYGVRRFYVNLHFETTYSDDQCRLHLENANAILREFDLAIHSIYRGPFDARTKQAHHEKIRSTAGDWTVSCDIDEFHEFPEEVDGVVRFLENASLDYMRGRFVDRIARDGFPALRGDLSVWRQFPLGAAITGCILQGCPDKILLARSTIPLDPGHHYLLADHGALPHPDVFPTHHFKWDASVVPRLKRRLEEDWKARCPWWVESENALRWIDDGGFARTTLSHYDFEDDRLPGDGGPRRNRERYSSFSFARIQ